MFLGKLSTLTIVVAVDMDKCMSRVLSIGMGIFSVILLSISGLVAWVRQDSAQSAYLVFETHDGINSHIYRMNADGSNVIQLSPPNSGDWQYPQWSPTGQWVLAVGRNGNRMVVIRPYQFGALQTVLSSNFAGITMQWSPQGDQIAYTEFFERFMNVHVVNMKTATSAQVTDFGEYRNGSPIWSPDGTRFAFLSDRSSITEIYQIDSNGQNIEKLTSGANPQTLIGWSPDGQYLYYVNYLSRIMKLNIDDPITESIIIQENGRIISAELSPDGEWLSYVLIYREGVQQPQIAYIMQSDGTQRQQILEEINSPNQLAWASNGEWLVFTAEVDDFRQIFRLKRDTNDLQQLTFDKRNHSNPQWSPIVDFNTDFLDLAIVALMSLLMSVTLRIFQKWIII